jgi:hypothetical protein
MTYIGEESYQTGSAGNIIYFGNGVMFESNRMEAKINGLDKNLSGIPESIIYPEDGILKEKRLPGASLKLSVLIIPNPDGQYSSIIAPKEILHSILFRLYYMDGIGLDHFRKFSSEEDPRLTTKYLPIKSIGNITRAYHEPGSLTVVLCVAVAEPCTLVVTVIFPEPFILDFCLAEAKGFPGLVGAF